ncbi:MAG: hypothetical protein M3281_03420, partial [Chloroflexota bacterium]|nr:hypothetical protein [Chloroflexota bacterium]
RYVEQADRPAEAATLAETMSDVVAVGCSGMAGLYFNFTREQANLTEIEALYPGILDQLVEHPGIGVVIGRQDRCVVVLGKRGRLLWDGANWRTVGRSPLIDLDPAQWTLDEILRIAAYPRSADLIVFGGLIDGIGVAFEEQMGVHGAFGGPQAYPFVLYPPTAPIGGIQLGSSHDLYTVFLSYLPPAPEPPARGRAALTRAHSAIYHNH